MIILSPITKFSRAETQNELAEAKRQMKAAKVGSSNWAGLKAWVESCEKELAAR